MRRKLGGASDGEIEALMNLASAIGGAGDYDDAWHKPEEALKYLSRLNENATP